MTGEWWNFWSPSSGTWQAAGAALAADIWPLANWILKLGTSSPDCCASRVITANSSCLSSSVPGAWVVFLALSSSVGRIWIVVSILVWSHWGGRNCCACSSVICFCDVIICSRWSQTRCTMLTGFVYSSTLLSTSCAQAIIFCLSMNFISGIFVLTSPPTVAWSSSDTRATWSCYYDPHITVSQADLPVPIIRIHFRRSHSQGCDNNLMYLHRLWCFCCCWCVSLRRMSS